VKGPAAPVDHAQKPVRSCNPEGSARTRRYRQGRSTRAGTSAESVPKARAGAVVRPGLAKLSAIFPQHRVTSLLPPFEMLAEKIGMNLLATRSQLPITRRRSPLRRSAPPGSMPRPPSPGSDLHWTAAIMMIGRSVRLADRLQHAMVTNRPTPVVVICVPNRFAAAKADKPCQHAARVEVRSQKDRTTGTALHRQAPRPTISRRFGFVPKLTDGGVENFGTRDELDMLWSVVEKETPTRARCCRLTTALTCASRTRIPPAR